MILEQDLGHGSFKKLACLVLAGVCIERRHALSSKGARYLGQMLPAQNPGTLCTCVSPHQSVPKSVAQHPSPGLHRSHRLKTSDSGARWSTGEQGRHLSTEGGCHSPSGCFTTPSPQVQSVRV